MNLGIPEHITNSFVKHVKRQHKRKKSQKKIVQHKVAPSRPMVNILSALRSIRPYLLIFGAIFYTMSQATLFVGWQSLRSALIAEGAYHNLCHGNSTSMIPPSSFPTSDGDESFSLGFDYDNGASSMDSLSLMLLVSESSPPDTCIQQTLRLDLIFVVATSVLNLSGLGVGILVDTIGPRLVCILGALTVIVGQILFAFSNSVTFDAYIPGFTLISAGGMCVLSSLVSTPNLFPAKVRPYLNTTIMSSQDTGALTYMLFQVLQHRNGKVFSLRNLFLMYLIVPLSLLIFSIIVPRKSVTPISEESFVDNGHREEEEEEEEEERTRLNPNNMQVQHGEYGDPESASIGQRVKNELGQFWTQFFTIRYLALLVWGSVTLSVTYFYFTTQNDQWLWISGGDEKWANKGSFIFSILLVFVGLASIVLTGTVMRFTGIIGAVVFVGFLNVLTFILSVIPSKSLQYVTLVTLIIGRVSCFGVWIQFVFNMFSSYNTTLLGFSTLTAGVVNLLNYLWTYLAKKKFNGNFLYVNLGMGVAIILATSFIVPVLVFHQAKTSNQLGRARKANPGET